MAFSVRAFIVCIVILGASKKSRCREWGKKKLPEHFLVVILTTFPKHKMSSTLLVEVPSAEMSFTTLRRMKTRLRSRMGGRITFGILFVKRT